MTHEKQTETAQATKTKEYLRPMPTAWWLKRKTYFLFMVRELTCVAVGGYAILLLAMSACANDASAFHSFVVWLKTPVSVVLHLFALPLVLYHSITWFNLTPKVMVLWRGEERVSPLLIAGSNYVVWVIVSVMIAWFFFQAK